MTFSHSCVMLIMTSPSSLWLSSCSLASTCFASCNHGKTFALHRHESGGTSSLYAAVFSVEIGHHPRQSGHSDRNDIPLRHHQPAYSGGSVGHERSRPISVVILAQHHWYYSGSAAQILLALLARFTRFLAYAASSLTSLLKVKCALQLPQALLGSRRPLFDFLLLSGTNSLIGALKSSCVMSSIDP